MKLELKSGLLPFNSFLFCLALFVVNAEIFIDFFKFSNLLSQMLPLGKIPFDNVFLALSLSKI